jgi:hypothetical protein
MVTGMSKLRAAKPKQAAASRSQSPEALEAQDEMTDEQKLALIRSLLDEMQVTAARQLQDAKALLARS